MFTFNCRGKLLSLEKPLIMGILNITPDSFYDGGRYDITNNALFQAEKMLMEGADILDLGAASSRSGAKDVSTEEELQRILPVVETILKRFPEAIFSIDTWRARVAEETLMRGAYIINDISAGTREEEIMKITAQYDAPYCLMHHKGTPDTMQQNPEYNDVVIEVTDFLIERIAVARSYGIKDVVADLGFGFGKTVEHNYELLQAQSSIQNILQVPMLTGISRKSMICKPLGIKPENALNGTTALNMVALLNGANILRVHDVKEAVEVRKLFYCLTK